MANEKLLKIFDNINDLQKFAEAKNGAIIALNSAMIIGLLTIFWDKCILLPMIIKIYLFQMLLFFLASIVICLLSLIPRFSYKKKSNKKLKNENYVYFMKLADYKVSRFLYELSGKDKKKKYTSFEKNIARQAIINARITRGKFQMSYIAVIFNLSAIFTPVIVYPIHFVYTNKSNRI